MIEAERKLTAAAERHREAVASLQSPGRPATGQHVAVKVVGRAVYLVSFALSGAAEAGVPFDRLVELTGWDPDLVREGLEQPVPAAKVAARLAPEGIDAGAVAQAARTFEAIRRLRALTDRVLADVDHADGDERPPPAAADVADLHDRIERAWSAWREDLHPHD